MIGILLSYIIFNIVTGIVLTLQYYETEGGIFKSSGYWGLALFPIVGWGKWMYQQETKPEKVTEFPQSWFMYKYMVKLHWIYLIIMAFITVFSLLALSGFLGDFFDFDSGPSNGNGMTDVFDVGLGIAGLIASVFIFFFALIASAFVFALLFIFLIFIPKNRMKNIESEVYRQKYLEATLHNKSQI